MGFNQSVSSRLSDLGEKSTVFLWEIPAYILLVPVLIVLHFASSNLKWISFEKIFLPAFLLMIFAICLFLAIWFVRRDLHRSAIIPDCGSGKPEPYPSISPINMFRLIADRYWGADLPLIPDRSFWCTYDRCFDYTDVTDTITVKPH